MDRRTSLKLMAGAVLALPLSRSLFAARPAKMTVYKSPTCGCCGNWIKHVRAAGFTVEEVNVDDVTPYKQKFGVPADLVSCHTGVIGSLAFEGHVPADLIQKLVAKPPKGAAGLAVPGMPMGSPGMEVGSHKDAYDVVLFTRDGQRSVYAKR